MKKITLIGIGLGNPEYLTKKAQDILKESENVIASERIKNSFKELNHNIKDINFYEIEEYIFNSKSDVVLLVSGDCGFYSLSKNIKNKFSGLYSINIINGINSMQYLASKLNVNYDDWKVLSVHGRDNLSFIGNICYNKNVFVFTGGKFKPQYICSRLCEYGMNNFKVTVGEQLSYDDEKITIDIAENIKKMTFKDLNVVLVENTNPCNVYEPLFDCDFIRTKVPMTKENVRWISLNNLKIKPQDVLYDIGAGTGSISIEGARKAYDGIVVSIEKDEEAIEIIKQNITKHKTFNIKVLKEKAPLKDIDTFNIPVPDKVFIGGSSGNLYNIIEWIYNFNKHIRVVINCITIETLTESVNCFKKFNFFDVNICCVNISNSQRMGDYNIMKANNPVYIISGDIKNEK